MSGWRHHLAAVLIMGLAGGISLLNLTHYHPPGTAGTRFFGYGSLALLCGALAIGPLARLCPRAFSRLIPARRALGVWSAVAAGVHFLYVLQMMEFYDVHSLAGLYSFDPYRHGHAGAWRPGTSSTGAAIWLGTLAAVILAALAVISNDRAQRWLGADTWKHIQRQAYTALLLVGLHFAIIWFSPLKLSPPKLSVGWYLLGGVLLLQAAGVVRTIWLHRRRAARRAA